MFAMFSMRCSAVNRRAVMTLGWFFLIAVMAIPRQVAAETIRVLSPGQTPNDKRLGPLKDLNGYFPFSPANSIQDWNLRAEHVRQQLLVSLGLWPLPTRTPLNPVIHGKVERDDYTVERAYFESVPGFFVTGSLYRPKGQVKPGKLPAYCFRTAIGLTGGFTTRARPVLRKKLSRERRSSRKVDGACCKHCASTWRMGCVVFHYDMLGYADSQQIPSGIAHGFAKQRPEMIGTRELGVIQSAGRVAFPVDHGFANMELDSRTRLLVEPSRRRSQSARSHRRQRRWYADVLVGRVDPRPKAAFPAVMVTTAMQGGCTCENACNLRIDTGNVEFAALFGPKPLGMTTADDWTKEMATKGFPELQQHFRLLGVPDNVFLISANRVSAQLQRCYPRGNVSLVSEAPEYWER